MSNAAQAASASRAGIGAVLAGREASTAWSCRAATPAASSGFRRREAVRIAWRRTSPWTPVSGRGKVFSFVIFHRVYHPAFAQEVPYVVALVELEEGPRLLTNIVGVPARTVACEMPVKVVFDDVGGRRRRAEIRAAERARQVMGALDTDMRVRCGMPRAGCQPLARCSCPRSCSRVPRRAPPARRRFS